MGELIRGKFGRQEEIQEPVSEAPSAEVKEDDTATLYEKALAADERGDVRAAGFTFLAKRTVFERIREMEAFLASLQGFRPSRDVLADSERHWMSLPHEALADSVLRAGPAEWSKEPGRYEALSREYGNRIRRVLDSFK